MHTNISWLEYLLREWSFSEVFAQLLILLGLPFFPLSFSSKGDNDVILVAAFLASPYGIPEAY